MKMDWSVGNSPCPKVYIGRCGERTGDAETEAPFTRKYLFIVRSLRTTYVCLHLTLLWLHIYHLIRLI